MSSTHSSDNGRFERKDSVFRDWISSAPGSRFPPAAGRYHLYVSLGCPWAHRTVIVKGLKGLDAAISHTVTDWLLDRKTGWAFTEEKAGCQADPIHGFTLLRQVYALADPSYSGKFTVPVLFDRVNNTIVNNESADIIRMLNSEFNEFSSSPAAAALDLYPAPLRPAIDDVNGWVYDNINNGVYKAGFATSQSAYDEAVTALFQHLDGVEELLSRSRYLTGPQLTEADVRLFVTLLRFDIAYHGHFKCNLRRLRDYSSCWAFMLELSQMPAIRRTIDLVHIKHGYYMSHDHINPTRIVPKGPIIDLDAPHGRDKLFPIEN